MLNSKNQALLIDTHSHLFWESFKEDFDQVIQNALDAGVTTAINVGVDIEQSKLAAQIENDKLKLYSSIAIHPEEALRYKDQGTGVRVQLEKDIAELENIYLSNPKKVVAVGECGLDFAYFSREGFLPEGMSIEEAKDLQRKLLQTQIDLAKKHNLPLLLHVRDDRSKNPENTECWDEVVDLTKDHFGIYHCYSGLMATTKHLSPNFLISFAGNLTYPKNEYLREAVKFLPLEKICLETDCPFLPPQSIRGKRNEPSSVKEIAECIAQIKGITFEEVAKVTTENVKRLLSMN